MKHVVTLLTLSAIMLALACASTKPPPPSAENNSASGGLTLDNAIAQAAQQIDARIERGAKIAIVNFSSPADAFSTYVIDELTANLVESGRLAVIDRAEIDRIRDELQFQVSGEVDDNSIQELGRVLGAQFIVTGSYTSLGELHRIVVRALAVQTAAVTVQYRGNVVNDDVVNALLAGGKSAQNAMTATTSTTATTNISSDNNLSSAANSSSNNQRARGANSPIPNGTYTFHPRLQPYKGATLEQNVYIPKIVVRGDYMSVYFCANATGAINNMAGGSWVAGYNQTRYLVLQNLDDPSQSWNPEHGMAGPGYNWNDDGGWIVFRGVRGTRFSLTNNESSVPSVFEEIILGEPDE